MFSNTATTSRLGAAPRIRLLVLVVTLFLGLVPGARAWNWPVDGPVLRPFSLGDDPYAGGQHRGIDVGADVGAPVRAPASGTVSFSGSVPGGGGAVTIRTGDGYAVTLLQLGSRAVREGAVLEEGETVGTVGPSVDAVTRSSHVHLGVRVAADPNGYVDPLGLLPRRPSLPPATSAPPAPAPAPVRPADAPTPPPIAAQPPAPAAAPPAALPAAPSASPPAAPPAPAPAVQPPATPEPAPVPAAAQPVAQPSTAPRPAPVQPAPVVPQKPPLPPPSSSGPGVSSPATSPTETARTAAGRSSRAPTSPRAAAHRTSDAAPQAPVLQASGRVTARPRPRPGRKAHPVSRPRVAIEPSRPARVDLPSRKAEPPPDLAPAVRGPELPEAMPASVPEVPGGGATCRRRARGRARRGRRPRCGGRLRLLGCPVA